MKPFGSAVLMTILLGCSHSEPFATSATGPDTPFGDSSPYQLTFNPGDDDHPAISNPGELSYQFQRGTPDRDICAAILPASGGSRTLELCANDADDFARSDLFGNLVRLDGGRLAWTHHWSATGNQAPQSGGLYLRGKNSADSAVRVLPLMVRPAGAAGRWDQLLAPVRTGPTELTALAVQWTISQLIPHGPLDTVVHGVEIARIDLATNPATIIPVAPATNAFDWSRDPADGSIYFARATWRQGGDAPYRTPYDTVFHATSAGIQPVWSWPGSSDDVMSRLDGVAVVNGRLFVARQSTTFIPGPIGPVDRTVSIIAEVVAGTELPPINVIEKGPFEYWEHLAATADGRALIAERIDRSQKNLFRLDLTP